MERLATLLRSVGQDQVRAKGKGKKDKVRNVKEDEESESWNESSQHDHQQGQQRGSQDSGNVRRAGDARGTDRVRRIEIGRMRIIEEVEDDEDFIDLSVLFAGFDEDATVRMVKMTPVCDMSMGDEEEYERDELHWWYESTRSQQEWIEKLVEIPITGHGDEDLVEENSQQEWKEKLVEIPITGPIIEESNEDKVRMVNLWDDSLIEVVLDSGADTHVLPLSYYSDELGTSAYPKLKLVIRDTQGNAIHTTEQKMNITFEFRKENGKKVCVMDSAVFGNVTQPLFAVGKLWKCGCGIEPKDSQSAYLKKGKTMVPIRFSRNSTVTDLRIYRAETRENAKERERMVRKLTVK